MISFMHAGPKEMASYRYRAVNPARELGASLNRTEADVHIYVKPVEVDVRFALQAKAKGKTVIVDFCDLHFDQRHYIEIMEIAHLVTCPTEWTKNYLMEEFDIKAEVIPDGYEFTKMLPHCDGNNLLWFGSSGNYDSLQRVLPSIKDYPLRVVSNVEGSIKWSHLTMLEEFAMADIVVIPETAPYKSNNRAIEAIRQGCFVVAEPHPSLEQLPIWKGNIKKGIEWAIQNLPEANQMTLEAQSFIEKSLSPTTLATAWKTAIQKAQSNCTLDQERLNGTDG